jgi:hypothetical protein
MKLTIAIDPGRSGGYAIAWGGLHDIKLHSYGEDFEFVEHLQDLKDHPIVTCIDCVVEEVPSYAGKNVPSHTSFKLGKNCGVIEGALRMAEIPFAYVRPQVWQKGLSGLKGLAGAKRKGALKNHAKRLFPKHKVTLATADALLILNYHINQ